MSQSGTCEECGSPAQAKVDSLNMTSVLCDFCADALLGFHRLPQLRHALQRQRRSNSECPYCRTTADAVLQSGLAGCPLCYEAFPQVWKKLGIGPQS